MRALMASVGAGRAAHRGDRRALRHRRAWPTRCPAGGAHPRPRARASSRETFAYGTHRFTDAIDSDGHGNGPFHIRLALTRERGPDGEDRFIFDATETDDQSPGPVNLLLNPDVPGTALSMFYLGGDPAQVCNAGGPQALDEVRLREGSLLWPKFPAPLGMRGLTLMRFLAAVNGLDQRRRRQGACRAFGLRDLLPARHLPQRQGRARAVPDVRRHRRRLGRAAHRRRHRRRLFRGAGELPCRVPRNRLPGAAAQLRHPRRFLRRRAGIAAAAASCASTTSWPRRRCWRSVSTA